MRILRGENGSPLRLAQQLRGLRESPSLHCLCPLPAGLHSVLSRRRYDLLDAGTLVRGKVDISTTCLFASFIVRECSVKKAYNRELRSSTVRPMNGCCTAGECRGNKHLNPYRRKFIALPPAWVSCYESEACIIHFRQILSLKQRVSQAFSRLTTAQSLKLCEGSTSLFGTFFFHFHFWIFLYFEGHFFRWLKTIVTYVQLLMVHRFFFSSADVREVPHGLPCCHRIIGFDI